MGKQKTVADVRGFKIKCKYFVKCPLCYGCRNYNSKYLECEECRRENAKKNLCNKELHKDELISKMIIKDRIKLTEKVDFKNGRK